MATATFVNNAKPTSTFLSSAPSQPTTFRTVAAETIFSAPSATSLVSTPSETVAAAPATAPSPPTMKPAQIAGLSVAAAATFIIAIGLMALSIFLRKRRERNGVKIDEEKPKPYPPYMYTETFYKELPAASSPRIAPKQFPMNPVPYRQDRAPHYNPYINPTSSNTSSVPMTSSSPRKDNTNMIPVYQVARPAASKPRTSTNSSMLPEQIGLAISADNQNKATAPIIARSQSHRQQRRSTFRLTMDSSQRPDSVLTQNTLFEEDVLPSRRRSSKLLPTPPIPIPPIRSFQPSRPPPAFNLTTRPVQFSPSRPHGPQQPDLSLNIPVRHSRSLAEVGPYKPAPSPQMLGVHDQNRSRATSTGSSETGNAGDIPDYYFTAHKNSPQGPTPVPAVPRVQSRASPKNVKVRPKLSSSTVSRTNSRASTNIRDSISSQTSFESVDSSDTTPEEDDEGKQLGSDNQLSPVAESTVSMLRYPKVPRASNQLVPRSPRSPRSVQGQQSPRRLAEPSALLMKRRGEKEALGLEDRLQMESPQRKGAKEYAIDYRNSIGPDNWDAFYRSQTQHSRTQSGQVPQSPAMYDTSVQRFHIRPRQQQQPVEEALKSPAWIPELTPRRHGDDLFLSVSYSPAMPVQR